MKNIFLIVIALLAIVMLNATDIDDDAGSTGFKMLLLPSSAISAGQAGNTSFFIDDAFGFLSNPTHGLTNPQKLVSINSYQWFLDTQMTQLAFSQSNHKSSFGISMRYFDYGEIENRDESGNLIGDYRPMDGQIAFNYARRINPNHFVGVNSSLIYEKIQTASAFGVSFDLGYVYKTPLKNLSLSYALKNAGSTAELDNEKITLPLSNNLAFNYKLEFMQIETINQLKISQLTEDDSPKVAASSNIKVHQNVSLRGGYKFKADTESFSGGFSLNIKNLSLDYSYVPFDELGDVHIIGLSYKL